MSDWSQQEKMADDILNSPDKVIYVAKDGPRNGATVSIIKRAIENGKTIALIEPYLNIFKETFFNKVMPLIDVKSSDVGFLKSVTEMCPRSIKYSGIPFSFKNVCRSSRVNKDGETINKVCAIFDECPYQEFLANKYQIILLTYAKLNRLNKVSPFEFISNDPDGIISKIMSCDIIFLDEYSHSINIPPVQVDMEILYKIVIKAEEYYSNLPEYKNWHNDKPIIEGIKSILFDLEHNKKVVGKSQFRNISKWMRDLKLNKLERDTLLDTINLFEYDTFYLINSKRKIEDGYEKFVSIVPDTIHPMLLLNETLKTYKGKVIITDALLPSTRIIEGNDVVWPDFKNTQEKQLVVCDTREAPLARYASELSTYGRKYEEQMARLKSFLTNMCDRFGAENFLIFCVNTRIANEVRKWNTDLKVDEYPRISYYRSGDDVGVPSEKGNEKPRRILVCVNLPVIPEDSWLAFAQVFHKLKDYDRFRKSYRYHMNKWKLPADKPDEFTITKVEKLITRDEGVNTLINAIGRVKDPEGKDNSMVIIFGETYNNVIKWLSPEKYKIIGMEQMRTKKLKKVKSMVDDIPIIELKYVDEPEILRHFENQLIHVHVMWMGNSSKSGNDYRVISTHARIFEYLLEHPKESYTLREVRDGTNLPLDRIKKACSKYSYLMNDQYVLKGLQIHVKNVAGLKKLAELK